MKPCPADLAFDVLANNPGKWFAHPDLFRAIRQPNGKPLPVTTALNQRLNERLRAARRKGLDAPVRTMNEIIKGAIQPVFYSMTYPQAAAWKRHRSAQRAKKEAA